MDRNVMNFNGTEKFSLRRFYALGAIEKSLVAYISNQQCFSPIKIFLANFLFKNLFPKKALRVTLNGV